MPVHFLGVALRRMRRNTLSSTVNLVGLSLGITGALIIATLLRFETEFNTFPKRDRLCRIVTDEYPEGELSRSGASPGPMAELLVSSVPEVERAVVLLSSPAGLLVTVRDPKGEKKFREGGGIVRTAPEFFTMFDIAWIAGDPASLANPGNAALSQSVAERYFGGEDPLGRTIRLNNAEDLTVVGIVPDPPVHTDLQYHIYISSANLRETQSWMFAWTNFSTNVQTYLQLREGATPAAVEARLPALTEGFYRSSPDKKVFRVQPVAEMHYEPWYSSGVRAVDRKTLGGLALIGIFLLLTASINFVNMATAQAAGRSREVGVRKVLGATPRNISLQFLGETSIVVIVSTALSLVFAEILTPMLAAELDIPVSFEIGTLSTLLMAAGIAVATIAFAGIYPAVVIAAFRPSAALKGAVTPRGLLLRRGLVVFQFAISQLLVIGTLVVTLQMGYMLGREMGFQGNGIVAVPLPESDPIRLETIRRELLTDSRIAGVSYSFNTAISNSVWDSNVRYEEQGQERRVRTVLKFADPEYFETYGLGLVAGRVPHPSDTVREIVVNEEFARKVGVAPADLLGRMFRFGRIQPVPVVGVVRDFNTQSLHNGISPTMIAPRVSSYAEMSVKIRSDQPAAALVHIEKVWAAAFPEYLFESEFLDERIEAMYLQERRVEFLFRVFSIVAIIIGCIGLFGLVSFIAARKTKEIGIRKVLGASMASIVGMFSKEFSRLILIAFAAAAPAGYFAMQAWLEDFAYRISIGPWVFLGALGTIAVITGLTIGYRALRAAAANPVDSLRYE